MRSFRTFLTVGVFIALTGCSSLGSRLNDPIVHRAKRDAKTDSFFAAWNDNSRRLDSLVGTCDVDGVSQGQPFSLNSKIAYQYPNKFRLLGRFMGKQEADFGSNEEEFWFWIARAEPAACYFCKRSDLSNIRLNVPFQPDWIIEALGVKTIDASQFRIEKTEGDTTVFASDQTNPMGMPIVKRIFVDRTQNRVRRFEISSKEGRLLTRAEILAYRDDPTTGLYLPRKIRINYPDAETEMTLSIGRDLSVNMIVPEFAKQVFRRSEITNAQIVDLANPPPGFASSAGRGRQETAVDRPAPNRAARNQQNRDLDLGASTRRPIETGPPDPKILPARGTNFPTRDGIQPAQSTSAPNASRGGARLTGEIVPVEDDRLRSPANGSER